MTYAYLAGLKENDTTLMSLKVKGLRLMIMYSSENYIVCT